MARVNASATAARRAKAVRLGDAAALLGYSAARLGDPAVRIAVLAETGDRDASSATWGMAYAHRASICHHLLDAATCAGAAGHYA